MLKILTTSVLLLSIHSVSLAYSTQTCSDCGSQSCCYTLSRELAELGGNQACSWQITTEKCVSFDIGRPTKCENARKEFTCGIYARISQERKEEPCGWLGRQCSRHKEPNSLPIQKIPYLNQLPDICRIHSYDPASDIMDIACDKGYCRDQARPLVSTINPIGFLERLHRQLGDNAKLGLIECVPAMRLTSNDFVLYNNKKLPGGNWLKHCGITNIVNEWVYIRCFSEAYNSYQTERAFNWHFNLNDLSEKNIYRTCYTSGYFDMSSGPKRECTLEISSPSSWFW